MSVTTADVQDFIDQYAGARPIRASEIDRILRVLNHHRCPTVTTRPLPTVGETNVLSLKTSPEPVRDDLRDDSS